MGDLEHAAGARELVRDAITRALRDAEIAHLDPTILRSLDDGGRMDPDGRRPDGGGRTEPDERRTDGGADASEAALGGRRRRQ